jgi:hypothetical protein
MCPDTDDATSMDVDEAGLDRVLSGLKARPWILDSGEAILIRRADYLDTKVSSEYDGARSKGHLTLIQGGNHVAC